MDITDAVDFIREKRSAVLVTAKRSGRPQTSNIVYVVEGDEVQISVTETRAKTRNLRRDPRATLHVSSADFWAYVSIEADVEIMAVAAEPCRPQHLGSIGTHLHDPGVEGVGGSFLVRVVKG